MKKIATLMAAVITLTAVTPAWAADVDVYFKFKNSAEFVYKGVNDQTTKEQLSERINEDFPGSLPNLTEVYVVKAGATSPFDVPGQVTDIEPMTPEMRKEKEDNSALWTVFWITIGVVVAGYLMKGKGNGNNYKGNCLYSYQLAADGSRCGARAATVRPGGPY